MEDPSANPSTNVGRFMPSVKDVSCTLFINHIPSDVQADGPIEALFSAVGPIKGWKRVIDDALQPTPFGFLVFQSPESVERAVALFQHGFSFQGKPCGMKITPDASVLDTLLNQPPAEEEIRTLADQVERAVSEVMMAQASSFLESLGGGADGTNPQQPNASHSSQEDHSTSVIPDPSAGGAGGDGEMSAAEKSNSDIVAREIALFREKYAAKEQEKRERQAQEAKRLQQLAEELELQARERARADHAAAPPSLEQLYERDVQEADAMRALERERATLFRDRLQEWELYEQEKARRLVREAQELENRKRTERDRRDYMLKRLAAWDDDVEKDSFYTDRKRWAHSRAAQLKIETKLDALDEREEREEKSRQPAQPEIVVAKIMSKEERKEGIEGLVKRIPVDLSGVLAWKVRWECMSSFCLEKKLKPFIFKKIQELLGAADEDLVSFIVGQLAKHQSAISIHEELRKPLDEDADMFVVKLWRMLIYETEARFLGLD